MYSHYDPSGPLDRDPRKETDHFFHNAWTVQNGKLVSGIRLHSDNKHTLELQLGYPKSSIDRRTRQSVPDDRARAVYVMMDRNNPAIYESVLGLRYKLVGARVRRAHQADKPSLYFFTKPDPKSRQILVHVNTNRPGGFKHRDGSFKAFSGKPELVACGFGNTWMPDQERVYDYADGLWMMRPSDAIEIQFNGEKDRNTKILRIGDEGMPHLEDKR